MVMRLARTSGWTKPIPSNRHRRVARVSIAPRRVGDTLHLRVTGSVRVAGIPNAVRNCSFYKLHDGPVIVEFGRYSAPFSGSETEKEFLSDYNDWRPSRQPLRRDTIINMR